MMPGYYPINGVREPVPMVQFYPPARSYSQAKLHFTKDNKLYDKVKVENSKNGEQRPHRMFEKLRRQQSYDGDAIRMMYGQGQPRRPEGLDSLQFLGANTDDRYIDKFMDSRGRPLKRENVDNSKDKNTLQSNKSNNSKNSSNASSGNNKNNKEVKKSGMNLSTEIMAFLGSFKNSASVDNIYESVEQIHYRKSMESKKRREKVRSVHRTGHPLFDHLREEDAMATPSDDTEKGGHRRISRSAGPSRKTSVSNSPTHSSPSSGDEQDVAIRRNRMPGRTAMTLQHPSHHHQKRYGVPSWRRTGSAGSESDDEWVIPRPKIGGRRRDVRAASTDESDSSSKSSPMR